MRLPDLLIFLSRFILVILWQIRRELTARLTDTKKFLRSGLGRGKNMLYWDIEHKAIVRNLPHTLRLRAPSQQSYSSIVVDYAELRPGGSVACATCTPWRIMKRSPTDSQIPSATCTFKATA
ncbi:hypothetical protein EDB89DRAFT_483492 [Lactarius sanguifluus]|nr:hypothetical protein EDB89DRAFT_483492 [Lactarius sanguifluus]